MIRQFSKTINNFIQNMPEKVLLTIFLLAAGYGYFHFGLEDTVLIIMLQILFLLIFVWIIVVRSSRLEIEIVKDSESAPKETRMKRESDIETIQQLADHYHLQRRVDTEQDFKLFLKMILSTIKNTFVSYSALVYLWDQEKNLFILKEWLFEDAEAEVNHSLLPEVFPVNEVVNNKKIWMKGDGSENADFPACFVNPVPVKSVIVCPVFLENEVAGILILHSLSQEAFGVDDEPLLSRFSEIISKTILNYNNMFEYETRSQVFSTFYEISKELNSELKFDEGIKFLVRIVRSIFEYDRITVSLLEEDAGKVKIVEVEGKEDDFPVGYVYSVDDGLNGWVIRRHKSIVVSDLEKGDYFIPRFSKSEKSNYNLRSFMAAPIGFSGKSLGAVSIESTKPNLYMEHHENILVMLCNNIGMALERSLIYQQLESMARTDGLTGLNNYRSFRQRLSEEIGRAHRYRAQFSLLIMDIDHFKIFNDTYGHLLGDDILKNIAIALKKSLRNIDFVARYGGEEFCAILLNTVGESARLSAERIRSNVANTPLVYEGQPLPATVSVGVAYYPDDAEKDIELIDRADKALYRAKSSGRNRVVLYSDGK